MCREALGQGRRKALLLFTRSCCVVRAFCFLASFSLAASRKKERVGNKWARDDDAPLHYHLHLFSSAVFYFIFSGRAPISRLHGVHVLTRGPRWERFPHQPAGRPTDSPAACTPTPIAYLLSCPFVVKRVENTRRKRKNATSRVAPEEA